MSTETYLYVFVQFQQYMHLQALVQSVTTSSYQHSHMESICSKKAWAASAYNKIILLFNYQFHFNFHSKNNQSFHVNDKITKKFYFPFSLSLIVAILLYHTNSSIFI